MTILTVAPVNTPVTKAVLISSGTALDVEEMLAIVAPLGWVGDVGDRVQPNSDGAVIWSVTLQRSGYQSLVGYDGDWIVTDGINVTIVHGAAMTAAWTLLWEAVSTAPVAAAQPGGNATITLPQPTSSMDGSGYVYAVTQTDITTGVTGPATLVGSPVVAQDGTVTLTVSGMPQGDAVTFTVTCGCMGITATSLPTGPIAAIA